MRIVNKIIGMMMIILVIVVGGSIACTYEYQMVKDKASMGENIDAEAEYIAKKIDSQQGEVETLKHQLEEEYLIKARTVSYVLSQQPEMITDQAKLQQLAEKLGIEEIHISDRKGILFAGTVPDFYGMNYNDGEQMKPFAKCIDDKNFEIVQEATKRDSDGKLFQYIGVPRLDEPGIIQIGVAPEVLQEKLEAINIKHIVEGVSFDEKGKLYVLDTNNKIIVSSNEEQAIDMQADEYFNGQVVKDTGKFEFKQGKNILYAHYKTIGDHIVVGTLPLSAMKKNAFEQINIVMIIIVIAFILCDVSVFIFIKKSVVEELYKVLLYMKEIGKGDLTKQLTLNSSKEFKRLSEGINDMSVALKQMINESKNITGSLMLMSDELSSAMTETAAGVNEVAASSDNLIEIAEKQIQGAKQGNDLAVIMSDGLGKINKEAKESKAVVEETRNFIEETKQYIDEEVYGMNEISDKFQVTSDAINELGKRTDEINQILITIQAITDEINLLSLNASIEAARAGEAGRGFTVVAEQIKKLAENCDTATDEIVEIIAKVNTSVEEIDRNANDSNIEIGKQKENVLQSKQKYEKIQEYMGQAFSKSSLIEREVEKINLSLNDMEEFITYIKQAADENVGCGTEINVAVHEQAATIESISDMAKNMKSTVQTLEDVTKQFIV